MREKLLINDLHAGVNRTGGTTIATAFSLRTYLLASFKDLIFKHLDKDLAINGDLMDAFVIALFDLLELHGILRDWLIETSTNGAISVTTEPKIFLGRGNHDVAKDSSKLSSFDFLARLLKAEFGDRVVIVTEPRWLERNIYMIPHMPNQDLFDLALQKAEAELDGTVRGPALMLLHANYDNNFVTDSDHSLNVSAEQAQKLIARGWTLVFGHEHQARTALDERVIVTGNQWPSSIADCLGNPGDKKYAHIIHDDLDLSRIVTWSARGPEFDDVDFAEIDWRTLPEVSEGIRFIRVVGEAPADDAPLVIQAIAKFRQSYGDAFVITNAVKVAGLAEMAELPATAETIKAFDVLGYLFEQLDEKQREVVKGLLAKEEPRLKEAA
jgi:hypothetical protein